MRLAWQGDCERPMLGRVDDTVKLREGWELERSKTALLRERCFNP